MNTPIFVAQVPMPQGVHSFLERLGERPWVVLIEVLLIGVVVYSVLRFLHGTRGARLVRAVLIILVVSFALVRLVTERFEFDRINVLYPYFILSIFLISLVAFQSELRRLLLRLGQGGFLQRWLKSSGGVIDPVVTAAERLSKKKIGALLAIERGTPMGAVTETGVVLDAACTAELIETVFWPGTTLHDMGMIISNDRIVAAGCQFPLAESGDVDRALGSRHRAALGMSLETDALVIVVSEETGTISVALHGRMRRALTIDALRSLLNSELANAKELDEEMQSVADAPAPAPGVAPDGTGQTA